MALYQPVNNRCSQKGFSLVEVLMVLALLAGTILPFTLLTTQTSQISRGVYVQSTRSLFSAGAPDLMDAARSDYYTQFNDASMDTTSLSESGQVLPIQVIVDTANTDTFSKTAYLYHYKLSTDSPSAALSKTTLFKSSDIFRQGCGSTDNFTDSSHMEWAGDKAYDASAKQPGYSTLTTTTTVNNSSADILNASSVDDNLFRTYRQGVSNANVDYNFDVPNGDYNVALYFAETATGTTDTAPNRRRMDIYLEGTSQISGFSPYATTGALNRATVESFDIKVSDGTLNVSIRKNSNSDLQAAISGIVIKKLQVK